jgi:hypothetical protein
MQTMNLIKQSQIIAVACDCDEWTYQPDINTIKSLRKQWGSVCVDCGSKIDIQLLAVEIKLERLKTQLNPLAE